MKIIVTGAGGLIGRHLIGRFLEKDWEVYGIVHQYIPAHSHPRLHWIQVNLVNEMWQGIEPAAVDAVIHCAALQPTAAHTDEECGHANEKIDRHVFDFCEKNPSIRVAFFSSIYIEQYPEESLAHHSHYLFEKLQSEKRVSALKNPNVSFRISSPYGRHQQYRNVLKRFMENASRGEDIIVYGEGSRTQDFVNAEDIADAVMLFLKDETGNGIFNICSGAPVSMKTLAETVRDIAPAPVNVRFSGTPDPQEDYRANFSFEGDRHCPGWKPKTTLPEGLADWMKFIVR